jgi:hypothetical protein
MSPPISIPSTDPLATRARTSGSALVPTSWSAEPMSPETSPTPVSATTAWLTVFRVRATTAAAPASA